MLCAVCCVLCICAPEEKVKGAGKDCLASGHLNGALSSDAPEAHAQSTLPHLLTHELHVASHLARNTLAATLPLINLRPHPPDPRSHRPPFPPHSRYVKLSHRSSCSNQLRTAEEHRRAPTLIAACKVPPLDLRYIDQSTPHTTRDNQKRLL
jgi:hypothetical protein